MSEDSRFPRNLRTFPTQNLDDAFTRRLRFLIDFSFPDEAHRLRIWHALVPPQAPLSPDVDFAALAREFPLAGGNIKNVVLNAAFLAAADGGTIGLRHLLHGTRREFHKVGKVWTGSELLSVRRTRGSSSGRAHCGIPTERGKGRAPRRLTTA